MYKNVTRTNLVRDCFDYSNQPYQRHFTQLNWENILFQQTCVCVKMEKRVEGAGRGCENTTQASRGTGLDTSRHPCQKMTTHRIVHIQIRESSRDCEQLFHERVRQVVLLQNKRCSALSGPNISGADVKVGCTI